MLLVKFRPTSKRKIDLMDIFPMSDKMKAKIAEGPKPRGKGEKYPWSKLAVGQSFPVAMNDLKYSSLVSMAHKNGKRHGKVYKVVIHEDMKSYEVALVEVLEKKGC